MINISVHTMLATMLKCRLTSRDLVLRTYKLELAAFLKCLYVPLFVALFDIRIYAHLLLVFGSWLIGVVPICYVQVLEVGSIGKGVDGAVKSFFVHSSSVRTRFLLISS